MRVLVYQQLHAGHCYHYLHYLLPELLQITDDVVVALSAEGIASSEFTDLLAPFREPRHIRRNAAVRLRPGHEARAMEAPHGPSCRGHADAA